MRLSALELKGFRGAEHVALDFDSRLVLLVGDNGRGKSSLLQAIEWCLFGSIVAKKSSGIAARVDWELAFRGTTSTEVKLTFEHTSDGEHHTIELHRRRDDFGEKLFCHEEATTTEHVSTDEDGPRQADLFANSAPASPRRVSESRRQEYSGKQALARLEELGFPTWPEWRQAFCQHQELPRTRVVDTKSRNDVLASLLGLDAWTRVRKRLDDVKARKSLQDLGRIEARCNEHAEQMLAHDDDRAARIRESLRDQGVALEADALTLRTRYASRIAARATELAEPYGRLPICDPEDSRFAAWARDFPQRLWKAASDATHQSARLERRGLLRSAARQAQHRKQSHQSAHTTLEKFLEKHGDLEKLERERTTAHERATVLEETIRRGSARDSLLREAQEYLRARDTAESDCPLCSHSAPDLGLRIESELSSTRDDNRRQLHDALRDARATAGRARQNTEQLQELVRREADLRRQRDEGLAELAAQLDREDADPLSHAADTLRRLDREIEDGHKHLTELETGVTAFKSDVAIWTELGQLVSAEARDSRRPDLDEIAEREELELALDRAAAFATDIETLSRFAREEQARASDARLAEVEESFGFYLSAILESARRERGSEAIEYRFVQRGTAQNLRYDVVDSHGRSALAIANQATLSAIALSLLLARAETRARDGQPAFVVLDDPAQSLDAAHARGLVKALERVLAWCPVFVGTSEGVFSAALEELSIGTRFELGPFHPRHGVQIAEAS